MSLGLSAEGISPAHAAGRTAEAAGLAANASRRGSGRWKSRTQVSFGVHACLCLAGWVGSHLALTATFSSPCDRAEVPACRSLPFMTSATSLSQGFITSVSLRTGGNVQVHSRDLIVCWAGG